MTASAAISSPTGCAVPFRRFDKGNRHGGEQDPHDICQDRKQKLQCARKLPLRKVYRQKDKIARLRVAEYAVVMEVGESLQKSSDGRERSKNIQRFFCKEGFFFHCVLPPCRTAHYCIAFVRKSQIPKGRGGKFCNNFFIKKSGEGLSKR